MENNISLKPINIEYACQLANILNTDRELHKHLGGSKTVLSGDDYLSVTFDWCKKTNSYIFAIIIDGFAIGTITLSHINYDERAAKTGYWISSRYWNKGYTTKAFEQILEFAKSLNIKSISCSILKYNTVSLAIWKKFNANVREDADRYYPTIDL